MKKYIGLVCGECNACKAKKYNLCPEVTFFATPPVHGTMRKYMKHHFEYCYKIPDNMTTEEAAWCEPLSVGIHTGGNVACINPGETVAIFGAGPIGIINCLTSIGYGASKIIITERCVYTDSNVFAKMLYDTKKIGLIEYKI